MDNQQLIKPSGNEKPPKLSPFFSPATTSQEATIHRLYGDTHETIDDLMACTGTASKIKMLHELWVGWSLEEFGDGTPDEAITVKRERIDVAYEVMELMVTLANIGETWQKIQYVEKQYKTSNDTDHQSEASQESSFT